MVDRHHTGPAFQGQRPAVQMFSTIVLDHGLAEAQ
jgi:hypothetical protein